MNSINVFWIFPIFDYFITQGNKSGQSSNCSNFFNKASIAMSYPKVQLLPQIIPYALFPGLLKYRTKCLEFEGKILLILLVLWRQIIFVMPYWVYAVIWNENNFRCMYAYTRSAHLSDFCAYNIGLHPLWWAPRQSRPSLLPPPLATIFHSLKFLVEAFSMHFTDIFELFNKEIQTGMKKMQFDRHFAPICFKRV